MIPDKDKLLGQEEGGGQQCLASLVTHNPVKLAADGGGVLQVEVTTEGVQPPVLDKRPQHSLTVPSTRPRLAKRRSSLQGL